MSINPYFGGFRKLVAELLIRLIVISGIIALGLYLNRLFEALLVLVTILQFELAYRQHWFNKARSEPLFAVYVREEHNRRSIFIEIENLGPTPAYLLRVSRVLRGETPLRPEEWVQYMETPLHFTLKPSFKGTLAIIPKSFYEEKFAKGQCAMEVSYINYLDEPKSLFIKFSGSTPILVPERKRPPGFLLSLGEYFEILWMLWRLRKLRELTE